MRDHLPPELNRMIAEVELDDIRCVGISARARDGFTLPEPPGNDDVPVQISVKLRVTPGQLSVRVRAEALSAESQIILHYEATHKAQRILTFEPSQIGAFVAHVATPTIFPFLREGLAEVTRRLGVKPLMLAALPPPPSEEWVRSLTEQAAASLASAVADADSG